MATNDNDYVTMTFDEYLFHYGAPQDRRGFERARERYERGYAEYLALPKEARECVTAQLRALEDC